MSDKVKRQMREAASFVAPPLLAIERVRFCTHSSVVLNPNTRVVKCQGCDAEVSAFDALMWHARQYQRATESVDIARNQRRRIEDEIAMLRRERDNLKAQIKRAKK